MLYETTDLVFLLALEAIQWISSLRFVLLVLTFGRTVTKIYLAITVTEPDLTSFIPSNLHILSRSWGKNILITGSSTRTIFAPKI